MRYADILIFVLAISIQPALALVGEPVFVHGHITHAPEQKVAQEKSCAPAVISGREMCSLR
jgi:hypothetical protein